MPQEGRIFGEWEIGPGEPPGRRHLQVVIEGEVAASFEYDVRALKRRRMNLKTAMFAVGVCSFCLTPTKTAGRSERSGGCSSCGASGDEIGELVPRLLLHHVGEFLYICFLVSHQLLVVNFHGALDGVLDRR